MIVRNVEDSLYREVPTHIFRFQEKIFGFWTIQQLMYDTVAAAGLWYLWIHPLPLALRLALALVYILVVVFVVHIPVRGMPFLDWVSMQVRFALVPSRTVWRTQASVQVQVTSASRTSQAQPASVQATWVPLCSLTDNMLGFSQGRQKPNHAPSVERFCLVFETNGINLDLLTSEQQAHILEQYETFLAGLQFPLQTTSRCDPIDLMSYEPIQQQQQQLVALQHTPRLHHLAQKSVQFQGQTLRSCMIIRHYVVVSASILEIEQRSTSEKHLTLFALISASFQKRRRRAQSLHDTIEQLYIRAGVVYKGLTHLGLTLTQLDDSALANYYASSLAPGSLPVRLDALTVPVTIASQGGANHHHRKEPDRQAARTEGARTPTRQERVVITTQNTPRT